MPLARRPLVDPPVSRFQVLDNRTGDLVLFVLCNDRRIPRTNDSPLRQAHDDGQAKVISFREDSESEVLFYHTFGVVHQTPPTFGNIAIFTFRIRNDTLVCGIVENVRGRSTYIAARNSRSRCGPQQ
jgi:hypothetical protein